MKEYFYNDIVFTFEGAVSVESNPDYFTPWRIDYQRLKMFPVLKENVGRCCSGVRLCFTTDSKNIILKFDRHDYEIKLDIFINDVLHEKIILEQSSEQVEINTRADGKNRFTIWLDQRCQVRMKSISVNDGALIEKTPVTQKRWVHYGSSISHANAADSPSNIWSAITARKNNLHLTNFGFGGQCKIEPMMAFVIRDLPSDLITLKLGINVYPGDLTHRTFLPAILGFVRIIRDTNQKTPIVLISPIMCPYRENVNPIEGHVNLVEMRAYIKEAVEIFQTYGDKNIHYADGLKIFGPDEVKYMPDELHPNAEGQAVFAANFENEVLKIPELKILK